MLVWCRAGPCPRTVFLVVRCRAFCGSNFPWCVTRNSAAWRVVGRGMGVPLGVFEGCCYPWHVPCVVLDFLSPPSSVRIFLESVGRVVSVARLCNTVLVLCVRGTSWLSRGCFAIGLAGGVGPGWGLTSPSLVTSRIRPFVSVGGGTGLCGVIRGVDVVSVCGAGVKHASCQDPSRGYRVSGVITSYRRR